MTANSLPPRMKMQESMARLTDNIELRQYTATGAGIWLNSCIVIKLNDRILFSELRIGLYCATMQSSCLAFQQKWTLSGSPAVKLKHDVMCLEDCTLAFTPTGELSEHPQYCLQSLKHYFICNKCLHFNSILQRHDCKRSAMCRAIFTYSNNNIARCIYLQVREDLLSLIQN